MVPLACNDFDFRAFRALCETMANKRKDKMKHVNMGSLGDSEDPNQSISRKLQALYASVEDEGIPDRFLDLLDRLDAAEAVQSRGRNEADDDA